MFLELESHFELGIRRGKVDADDLVSLKRIRLRRGFKEAISVMVTVRVP